MMPALVVSTITPNYGQKLRPGSHFKVAELVGGKFAQKMHHTISCSTSQAFQCTMQASDQQQGHVRTRRDGSSLAIQVSMSPWRRS